MGAIFANDTDYISIDRFSPYWDAAWSALAGEIRRLGLGDGSDLEQKSDSQEVWQLIGGHRLAGVQFVSFRHRDHPFNGFRYSFDLALSV